jgi:hypothetical protein
MQPLIDIKYKLEKYEGKGGWTYARIPPIPPELKTTNRSVKVKGTIDGHAIKQYHLMPMGDGNFFLPLKAEIRKKIGKQAGDVVHIVLYLDNDPLEIPGEFVMCLMDEPIAMDFFYSLSESEQKYYVQWIYSAKRMETRDARMAKAINKLSRRLKMYELE